MGCLKVCAREGDIPGVGGSADLQHGALGVWWGLRCGVWFSTGCAHAARQIVRWFCWLSGPYVPKLTGMFCVLPSFKFD